MRVFLLVIGMFLFIRPGYAEDPPWMRGNMPKRGNDSYYFKVIYSEGSSMNEARRNAVAGLIMELSYGQGVSIKGKDILNSIASTNNGKYREQASQSSTYNINIGTFEASFTIVDICPAGKGYCALFEVANDPDWVQFENVEYTTSYGAGPFFLSMVVPGLGQISKGSTGKGLTFLTFEALCAGGAFFCYSQAVDYQKKVLGETDPGKRKEYKDTYTNYRYGYYGSLGLAGFIYLYNVIDAASAKGAKRYKKVKVAPYSGYFGYNQGYGLTLTIDL
ncbi:hypothetical protein FACS1894181_06010 [Bacteroidia bacterium]|nr:hypothetical protein FACS1894181_06010 [Bacteroidia bacterium]